MAFSGDDSRCALDTSTYSSLFLRVIAAGAWSTAAAAGVLERDEAPKEGGIKGRTCWTRLRWRMKAVSLPLLRTLLRSAACRCLTGCLHSAHFEALFCFIQCDVTIIMAAPSLTGSECGNTNDGKESDEDYGDGLHRGADYLRVFVH
ncbi:hypothetical protein TcCL_Unassigned03625 [Trypanosoma cruzi]|nr:hypothetical protein TcCL_Unassigned03625 [Trypanosoma cruzi]